MRRARQEGFSLLELLVVVAIIGIFVGVAVLSVEIVGRDRESEQEAYRLKGLLDLFREEALLRGLDYGLHLSATGYQIYYYDYGRRSWLLPDEDRALTERTVPAELQMSVIVDDRRLVLESSPDIDEGETAQPQIMILSTGEMTPFTLRFSRDAAGPSFAVTAQFDGDVEVKPDE